MHHSPSSPAPVFSSGTRSDQALKQAIRQELQQNIFLCHQPIRVQIQQGHVTLHGTVNWWQLAQAAVHIAFTQGAHAITSLLTTKEDIPL